MMLSDILQIIALSALVFFPLGYVVQRYLSPRYQYWKNRLLRPRYLKSDGVWIRDDAESQADK
ncbi:cellulose biosynthesis protein BcsF [Candidatus Symbiopectobacterium sp. NZEC135]|uniref:cellulose biosynthesis protein BcsF n=1 Tax=Candidatus Symbiopectobacterium sp. NZEC135 TaxID=2820471 RepID=UPI00222809D2|nr:cellulose biosynthesis protein BcsF [Candidatus Symbiopectobacterium sp. NZEC135]MCW2481144.1 cellulose biosynthesis protein BcsF [Candidatus Symbiopectobacterium sp. NZEC135]